MANVVLVEIICRSVPPLVDKFSKNSILLNRTGILFFSFSLLTFYLLKMLYAFYIKEPLDNIIQFLFY